MIYITAKLLTKTYSELYRAYETDTHSRFSINESELKQVLEINPTLVKNMKLIGNKLEPSHWFSKIPLCIEPANWHSDLDPWLNRHDGVIKYILLCGITNDKFKLLGSNQHIVFVDKKQLINYAKENILDNCTIENGKLKVVDYYMATENEQFREQIAEKYDRFEAVSSMLGRDTSFEYAIEGTNVELLSYTGTDKSIVVPKFITSLSGSAFVGCGIAEVILEEGLETIASSAFSDCKLSEITIPKTVQFMGLNVFDNIKRLINKDGEYKEEKIVILNNHTIVLDKIIEDKERHRGV